MAEHIPLHKNCIAILNQELQEWRPGWDQKIDYLWFSRTATQETQIQEALKL